MCRYALKDAATKGNAGKQEKEGTEGEIGTGIGTETEIVDPIGAGEVFLDITRVIISMNKIWQKIITCRLQRRASMATKWPDNSADFNVECKHGNCL